MTLVAQGAIVLAVVLVSLGLLWLARRSPYNARFSGEVSEHNKAFDFLGTAFAVLLAFVVLEAYESYNDAKSGAEEEAEAVLQLSRTLEAFTPEEQARLQGVLVCYGRAVVHHGWPAMENEEASPIVNDWGTRFRHGALTLQVESLIEEASFRQLLMEQDSRIQGRRTRLAEAVRIVPFPLWLVLLLGASLTIGWVILSAGRQGSYLVQAAVTASVAAMVTAALLLVYFLDHPFSDESGSTRPIEMEHTLETIDHEQEGLVIRATPPCTEEGDPQEV
jgi:Protein of unknown function (DUF4239)